ncbi:dTDP-4-amino-4,6-dideoxygalactose transaminase [Vibrio lentus]|uniref:dTDP-4-amino-4,6-dideoxygalactose transaminase n=1 Tax=Vibrio lentus TaxID=136468 RepID=UPI000C83C07E|nr:dTDP-4-amino-4,6-dideoxygalactose transaminase [Vibrio lentus]PMH28891.1 dTDP-4-amino-4,6-dideoxygalactose transaminase [Vibrio lentus]PMK68446.1 dTDP-4-amino-4,6-dideoxygalactose transaminase [Vibrio lentus]
MIPFSKPTVTGKEQQYIEDAIKSGHLSGDGPFTKKCHQWFEEHLQCEEVLLTPSCTAALEMAAILIGIKPGDEVIMPSYTFVSTANAFVLRGAKIVFVDIRSDTMNIDENLIEVAITPKTKAIVPVHYAGVACEMDTIMDIAGRHNLYVIEDAAQGMMSMYKGRPLGTIGHIGTYSFHETKNYTSGGEGGLLIINEGKFSERAEIIREKGTNRSKFFRGVIDKYSWVDLGSSYLPSELQAAYLWAQLLYAENINKKRLHLWGCYCQGLMSLSLKYKFALPNIPIECVHNGHIFYLKLHSTHQRSLLIEHLASEGIDSVFHYIPLHNSTFAEANNFNSDCLNVTESESSVLLRLPLSYSLSDTEVSKVVDSISRFFNEKY